MYSFAYSTLLIGTILILPLYLFDVFYLGNIFKLNVPNVSVMIFLGLGVSIIGMMIMNVTVLKIGPNIISMLFYATPLFTAMMAVTVLGEQFETFHFVGMGLIIVGVNLRMILRPIFKLSL